MKRNVLQRLRCPNSHIEGLDLVEIAVDEARDDVVRGVLLSRAAMAAYPIEHGIAVLLSDADTDTVHHVALLEECRGACPPDVQVAIDATITRLGKVEETPLGKWNREEMAYYDARNELIDEPGQSEFESKTLRPDWHRLLVRNRTLFRHFGPSIQGRLLLEVGCGTAKTIALSLDPCAHDYDYVGIELSWQRLLHARAIVPDGTFIQASAMNLPLGSDQAHVALALGALHHMAEPLAGLGECMRVVEMGGFIGFHEPMQTRKLIPEGTRMHELAERVFVAYEHSEHDKDIDYNMSKALLKTHGFRLVSEEFGATVLGLLLVKLTRVIPVFGRTRASAWFVELMDGLWGRTVGTVSERLGPRSVVHLSRKEYRFERGSGFGDDGKRDVPA